jgi:sugar lactone lactonase YvrE
LAAISTRRNSKRSQPRSGDYALRISAWARRSKLMSLSKVMTVTAAAILLAIGTAQATTLTKVASFDPSKFELPENLVFDRANNMFVSLLLANEVRKITPAGVQSSYATFDGAFGSLTAGLVINDDTGDLYVAYDPVGQNSVIYVVHPDRSKQVFATFPVGAGLNGMTPDDYGNLYLTDAFLGYVWRVRPTGGTPEIWIDLKAPGSLYVPGPNGIKFDIFKRNLYVSVSYQGTIYRIPFDDKGQAGTPVPFVTNITADDFAFDLLGNLYVATEPSQSVVRVHPDGTVETIASAADGLQNTSAVLFGRVGFSQLELYILSFALPPATPSYPGVYKMFVGLPGLPVSIP